MAKTSASTFFSPAWVDYSGSSTLSGWVSLSVQKIQYMIIGKQMIVQFNLTGVTSTGVTTASFTIPFANSSFADSWQPIRTITATTNAVGVARISASSSTVNIYPSAAAGNWQSAAGVVKTAYGTLIISLS